MVEVPQDCRVIWTAKGGVKCADVKACVISRGYVGTLTKRTCQRREFKVAPRICLYSSLKAK